MKVKQDTPDDDRYRKLTEQAAQESPGGYRAIAEEVGLGKNPDSGRVILLNWVNGKRDRQSRRYHPALSDENRMRLLVYLAQRYPAEYKRIEESKRRKRLKGLPVKLPESPRQVFAKVLAETGIMDINGAEIRAGRDIQQVYAPDGGLTEEDLKFFGPILSDLDRDSLAEAVESNRAAQEMIRSRRDRRKSSR